MRRVLAAVACVVVLGACKSGNNVSGPAPTAAATITVSSPAFADGATIPTEFTCDGAGARPSLTWGDVPAGTQSMAVIVEDPDAPGGTFVHWTAWGFDPAARAAAHPQYEGSGWTPPCPPPGTSAHHYRFLVYALRRPLALTSGASANDVRAAVAKVALARGVLTATYARAS